MGSCILKGIELGSWLRLPTTMERLAAETSTQTHVLPQRQKVLQSQSIVTAVAASRDLGIHATYNVRPNAAHTEMQDRRLLNSSIKSTIGLSKRDFGSLFEHGMAELEIQPLGTPRPRSHDL